MAAGGVGYYATGYFHANMWHTNYWAGSGVVGASTTPTLVLMPCLSNILVPVLDDGFV